MSLIGDIVGGIAKAVVPMALEAICPESALIPGLDQMVGNMVGDMLSQAVDQAMSQSGSPQFMINDALGAIKQVAQQYQQPQQSGWEDQIANQFGGLAHSIVGDFISDFLGKLKAECGHGGKGASGPVTLRDLAKALGQLEEQEAKKVKDLVGKATDALNDKSQSADGKGATGGSQFEAMENVKAESQIQSTLSSMVSEVIKQFGAAQQATARG
jgi:hypothetical protein